MTTAAILGASGYAGAELLRLASAHPDLDVVAATGDSQAGTPIASLYPNLGSIVGDRTFDAYDDVDLDGVEVAFCCLPHGASQALMAELAPRVGYVIDLAADFRLQDPELYPAWYGADHAHPELLDTFVYGLPELHRAELAGATRVAVPGCYPTAAILALAPVVRHGLVDAQTLVVDAASGVSGAGRGPKEATTFCTVDENFTAYGLLSHRHTPEMDQGLTAVGTGPAQVLFTPHLAPMNRGILATCYARPVEDVDQGSLLDRYREAYEGEPFVQVLDTAPSTKATAGANTALITVRHDPRTGLIVALCAIDNLVKGAAGQAVQCANLVLGLPETTGLPRAGLYP